MYVCMYMTKKRIVLNKSAKVKEKGKETKVISPVYILKLQEVGKDVGFKVQGNAQYLTTLQCNLAPLDGHDV